MSIYPHLIGVLLAHHTQNKTHLLFGEFKVVLPSGKTVEMKTKIMQSCTSHHGFTQDMLELANDFSMIFSASNLVLDASVELLKSSRF